MWGRNAYLNAPVLLLAVSLFSLGLPRESIVQKTRSLAVWTLNTPEEDGDCGYSLLPVSAISRPCAGGTPADLLV